ncbi:MAG: hypothetical protein Q8M08_00455 [Bacteroidales bacterium]|nr:hypothetical protein [Bacteroidales bacterium]
MKKITFQLISIILLSASGMFAADAPVTMAGNITNAIPGAASVAVPVTVTGFNNIGQFILTMVFDTTRVRFVSAATNPALTGMSVTYSNPISTQGKLVFSWTGTVGSNVTLADGSALANLTFSYVTGTGILSWAYPPGSLCAYKRYIGVTLSDLNDDPWHLFYKNGGISNRGAPITYAPVITVMAPGPVAVPITVNGFTGIGAITLYLEYNPAMITYQNFTKNPAFGSAFVVGNVTGNGGMMYIVIQWYGNAVTLANGATLCTLNFSYIGAPGNGTNLTWFDNGPSCEYTDGLADVLIDLPRNVYYYDGTAAPPLVSVVITPSANPVCPGTLVTFTATPTNGGTNPAYQWKVNGINTGTNSSMYEYAPLNNDKITCVLTSNAPFVAGNPATSNQLTMSVTSVPMVVADFSADNLMPRKIDTVHFTDLSAGDVTSWNWSFDRPGVVYLNGTAPNSQHPQLKFTDGGLYTVTLVANNSCFTDSEVKTGYLRVGIHGLWTGNTSSDWDIISNWDDYLIPDSNTGVVIPPAAQNWPVFEGDLSLGIHCGSLILSGPSSRMTVNGNLIIPQY